MTASVVPKIKVAVWNVLRMTDAKTLPLISHVVRASCFSSCECLWLTTTLITFPLSSFAVLAVDCDCW